MFRLLQRQVSAKKHYHYFFLTSYSNNNSRREKPLFVVQTDFLCRRCDCRHHLTS